ncbi:MAG: protein kinase [Thermoanaerobaculia bacterium]
MTSSGNDWQSLFDELVDLDPAARSERLAAIASADPALARFVAALLAADSTGDEVARRFETPFAARSSTFVAHALGTVSEPAEQRDRSGERIDAWRLVSPLGRGGMAEVYLAERVDGEFEQRAALKLVRSEVGSEGIYRRFRRERRILAQLEHPGIARLLDGGRTSAGEPYFVLELVEGKRITDHCRDGALPLAERLRLFAEACDAVDAAHRRLVVHRDLKPSNILVTPEGVVKLLDFGIAKLLDHDAGGGGTPIQGGSGSMTHLETQPLTPNYAAPEQILGAPVSTATDVFALGILLHEMVTDRTPFDRAAKSRGALAIDLGNETLVPPSSSLRRMAAATDTSARAGREARERLRRRAAEADGDLDTVVAKALAREPERRYRSAAALADDVRNLIARRPVRARADSFSYRASRFVSRNAAAVVVTTLAVLALVTLVVVALVQGAAARRHAQRAERVQRFLVELFRDSDPSRTRGETLTARELITTAAKRIEPELADDPDVAAELDDAVAQVELGLGLADDAVVLAERAIALRTRQEGATAPATLRLRVTLAEALFARGDLDGADREVAVAQPLYDRHDDEAIVDRLFAVESALRAQQNRFDEGLAVARRALERAEKRGGPNDALTLLWRSRLAATLGDASRVAEAEALLRPNVEALMRETSGDPLEVAEARLNAGDLLDLAGDRETGERLMQSAVDLLRRTLGDEHPEVALAEIKLGYLQFERRALTAAETSLRHAATVLDRVGHYEAGSARRYLGIAHLEAERNDEALAEFEAAEAVYRARGGAPIYLTSIRISRGQALLRLGRLAEAETLLRDIVRGFRDGDTSASDYTLRTALKYLAEVRRGQGDAVEALALHRQAREIELRIFGTDEHPIVAHTDAQIALDLLALARRDRGQLAEARTRIDRAVSFQRSTEPASARLGEFLLASARVADAAGDRERARREAAEARELLLAARGATHSTTRDAEAYVALLDRPTR